MPFFVVCGCARKLATRDKINAANQKRPGSRPHLVILELEISDMISVSNSPFSGKFSPNPLIAVERAKKSAQSRLHAIISDLEHEIRGAYAGKADPHEAMRLIETDRALYEIGSTVHARHAEIESLANRANCAQLIERGIDPGETVHP